MKKRLFPFIAAFLMLFGASSALLSCKDATADALQASLDLQNKIKAVDDSVIRAYLTRNKYVPGSANEVGSYTRTDAGLYVVTLSSNPSGTVAATGKQVAVKYIGRFINKTNENIIFDSSITGKTLCDCASFVVGSGMISGWSQGLPLMREGEHKLLFVPSYLAYGLQGNQGIPSSTPLSFDMEILAVSKQ